MCRKYRTVRDACCRSIRLARRVAGVVASRGCPVSDTAELPPPLTGWAGFEDPNYTNVPDSFFDVLLPLLTDVEIRVLLYIIRRTYGFKKAADQVSLSQITDGITTREGRVLDGGAGVSKGGAIRAIARLEARGILLVQRNRSAARGNEPTTYQLRKMGTPLYTGNTSLVHGVHQGGVPGEPALVHGVHIQETDIQETDIQEDSNQRPAQKKRTLHRNGAATPTSTPVAAIPPTSMRQKLPHTPVRSSQTHAAKIPETPDSDITSEIPTEGVANLPAPLTKRPPRRPGTDPPASAGADPERAPAPPYSPYIAGVIQDHSTDLGDAAHWRANVTQALRLWQASGIGEEAFVGVLHEARSLVRTYQGKQGTGTIANKMGYYFRCLADLVGVPTELGAGR